MKDKEKNGFYEAKNERGEKVDNNFERKSDIKLPNFFSQKFYPILTPYNYENSLKRLQNLTLDYFMNNDLGGYAQKDWQLDYDAEDIYCLPLDRLMILTDVKGEGGVQEFIELVNFSQYLNLGDEKKFELKVFKDKHREEIQIKIPVDFDAITKNIREGYSKSPFATSKGILNLAREQFSSGKKNKTPELDLTIKFKQVKRILETNDETEVILELSNPPLNRTNFLIVQEGNNLEFENIIFPFRNFNDEVANLKFRKFYLLVKVKTPDEKNDANAINSVSKNLKLKSLLDYITDKFEKLKSLKITSEQKYKRENKLELELNDYFIQKRKVFIEEINFDTPSLINFNYLILVLVSERILSYFNAVKYVQTILETKKTYFSNLDSEDFQSVLLVEALVKLIDLYQNSNIELTLNEFYESVKGLYLESRNEFKIKGEKAFKKKNTSLIRSMRVIVTPTYTLFMPFIEDQGNRILREYRNTWQAMRAVFKMDDFQDAKWNNRFLIEYIKISMAKGFRLSSEEYQYFGYSQSQFRSVSCWLVTNPDEIFHKTGDYSNIKVIAKFGARLGQTLTATTPTINIHKDSIDFLPEDVHNGTNYVFSDGVGMISYDLAVKIQNKLKLEETPAAFQGRFLGCKGVWTVMFDNNESKIWIRPSQKKFHKEPIDDNQSFEVCGLSKFIKSYLNRQIIILLSALGVEEKVFMNKLINYRNKLEDEKFILSLIHYDEWNSTFMKMFYSGVNRSNDRLIGSIVSANKDILYRDLKKRARIYIEEGAYVMGIMDEFGVLEEGEAFLRIKTENKDLILDKLCPVAKCPCLHSGDIRMLNFRKRRSDDPSTEKYAKLEQYENVIIFPQKGRRPHPNELSGSDLDGDQYFVFYDDDLKVKRTVEPMDYSDNSEPMKKELITRNDVINFFAEFVNNNQLGSIADAHMAHADSHEKGADGEIPKSLAKKFSLAVDAPKTGNKIILTEEEEPKNYPHYMGRKDHNSYHSVKILGKLYDKTVTFIEQIDNFKYQNNQFYDDDLILSGYQKYIFEALIFYIEYYQEILALLKKNDMTSESELLTGNCVDNEAASFGKKKGNYDLIEKIAIKMKQIFSTYKDNFNNSAEKVFNDKYLNVSLRNSTSKRASSFYYTCYNFTNILKTEEKLNEMMLDYLDEILEEKNYQDSQMRMDYVSYANYSLGGDVEDYLEIENSYIDEVERRISQLKEKLESHKHIILNFVEVTSKMYKMPDNPNEENRYRILSFPWCSAGDILTKIKTYN